MPRVTKVGELPLTGAERQKRYRQRHKPTDKTLEIRIRLIGGEVTEYLKRRDRAEYFGNCGEFDKAALVHGSKMVSNWGSGNLEARRRKRKPKIDTA